MMIGELSFTSTMFIVTCTVFCREGCPPEKKKKKNSANKKGTYLSLLQISNSIIHFKNSYKRELLSHFLFVGISIR